MTTSHSSGYGNGQLTQLCVLFSCRICCLPGRSLSKHQGKIRVKVEGTNTSYDPDHIDKHMDLLCQASSSQRTGVGNGRLPYPHQFPGSRNCNVLCFTETWLNPGIPDSAIQPGEDTVFLSTDINLLGVVDWVMVQSCFG